MVLFTELSQLTNAAILLFGKKPQRFLISSKIKCAHFHNRENDAIVTVPVHSGNFRAESYKNSGKTWICSRQTKKQPCLFATKKINKI